MRAIGVLFWGGLLLGCVTLDQASTDSGVTPPAGDAKAVVPASDVPPVVVQTQAVDLTSGMPRRLARDRRETHYPMVKDDFIYADQYPWLRLQFDPARLGRLLSVIEPSVEPVSIQHRPLAEAVIPSQLCATAAIAAPLDAGPRQNWVTRRAHQLAGNLWQSLFGDEDVQSMVDANVVPDPLANQPKQRFVPYSEADPLMLDLSGRLLPSGLLINVHLVEARTEPTFHFIYLEHRNCQRAWPDQYQVYQLWEQGAEWQSESDVEPIEPKEHKDLVLGRFVAATLDLSLAESVEDGSDEHVGGYQRNLLSKAPEPIWKQLGFDRPQQGVRALGSGFSAVSAAALGEDAVLVVHIARPLDTRYVTDALLFRVRANEDGVLSFTRL